MEPKIERVKEKKLVGKRLSMSFGNYRVGELWKSFLPGKKEISGQLSDDLIAVTVYKPAHFTDFDPANEFEKWAAIEVAHFNQVPAGMETFTLPGGLYAVFNYRGLSTDHAVFEYIFGTWLPGSAYNLDNRPHVEVLGSKYRNNDPDSEEEIWIPVKFIQP